ncbi:MAG TPA: type II secretion system protein GspK [Verrucomicrobiota bacterium]|jgi:type II secretory pathway component PulK|nr:type II secretion system protein GspK [Verrucomicrobiota bacterium]
MRLREKSPASGFARSARRRRAGSVLVIVLWIAFGLVSLALYFANAMSFELRAADNRVSAQAADQAIEGAVRYLNYLLAAQISNGSNGVLPSLEEPLCQAVPVGEAHYWLIGRDTNNPIGPGQLCFGLVDEAAKLNLNSAEGDTLIWLPRMTEDLTQAILDWRDTNGNGPTVIYYAMQQPAYQCKCDLFETVDELRLLYGADMDTLLGEDANRNGVLDAAETDDNQNNLLDPGVLEYCTVYSREPNTQRDGSARINVANLNGFAAQLGSLLATNFGAARADQILATVGLAGSRPGRAPGGGATGTRFTSPLAFYLGSGMTAAEFALISTNLTATEGAYVTGRVNVNTASAAVLACLLEGDVAVAEMLVNYRQSNPDELTSIAWVADALRQNYPEALQTLAARDVLTTQSYQFTADVAALGPFGRGYRRVKFVFDTSSGSPVIVYRQDLTHLGWALGPEVRQDWLLAGTQHD